MIFLPFKKTAWWLRWSTCIFGEICLASKKCLILTLSCNSIFVQDDLHIACEQAIKLIEGQSFVEAPEKVMAKVPKSLHVQISRSPQEASGVVNETFRLFSACESHSSQTHHLNYGKKKTALSECIWHWVSWDLKGQCQSNLPICIPFLSKKNAESFITWSIHSDNLTTLE